MLPSKQFEDNEIITYDFTNGENKRFVSVTRYIHNDPAVATCPERFRKASYEEAAKFLESGLNRLVLQ